MKTDRYLVMADDDREALQALAEDHVRQAWSPEGAPRILADEAIMAHFRATIAEELDPKPRRAKAQRPASSPAGPCPTIPTSGLHLYRLWAADGRLLYVGVSTQLRARIRTHRRRWGHLIARATWESHPDLPSMLAAERAAIRNEDPAFNKAEVG